MAAKSYQLALTGAAKRVSDVYGGTPGAPTAQADITYRSLHFQAETGTITIGSDNTVSASVYGVSIAVGAVFTMEPPTPGGPLHLSDFWAFGTGTLHILGVPL